LHAWHRCRLNAHRDAEQSHPVAKATEDNRMLCTLKEESKCVFYEQGQDAKRRRWHLYNVTMIATHKRKRASWVSQLWVGRMEGCGTRAGCDVRINIKGVVNGANSIHV
jgi:hypothetical protein